MELFITRYFENFFTPIEQKIFNLRVNNHKYTNNGNWLEVENEYKKILKLEGIENFKLTVAYNASYFIHNVFQKHVTEDTFVISVLSHLSVIEETNKTLNKYILTYDDVKKLNVNKLMQKFKESRCKKIFIYLSSLIEQNLITMPFCYKLKEEMLKQNMQHIICLDDVATMFLLPKDYSVFDYVFFTCHSLIPTFDSGMLFYKSCVDFGFEDYEIAKAYLIPLNMILTKKDKMFLFSTMLTQYFIRELQSELFRTPENSAPNIFCIIFKDSIRKYLIRYAEDLSDFNIFCSEYNITIRCNHFISQDITKMVEGLEKLKTILQKCIKMETLYIDKFS